jgi:hypothetical protein
MTTAIIVPWRDSVERRPLWDFVRHRLEVDYPDWPIVTAGCDDGPFSRAEAIVRGALSVDADVLVVTDADVLLNGDLREAVAAAERRATGWAVPHWHLRRLDKTATSKVLQGESLETSLPLAQRAYKGNETGTLVVLQKAVLLDVPPDVRFRGWGQEDEAWGTALRRIIGPPWRAAADLYHLWHPPAERLNRRFGNAEGMKLLRRYELAIRSNRIMQQIVDESIQLWRPEWSVHADAEVTPPSPTEPSSPDTTVGHKDGSSLN